MSAGKLMKMYVSPLGLSAVLLICTGCSSVIQHVGNSQWGRGPQVRYLYSGTQTDIQTITSHTADSDCVLVDLFGEGGNGQTLYGHSLSESPFMWPAVLIDLPFSFAVDTLLLPVDFCIMTIGGKNRDGSTRYPKQKAQS
jgi:uncharacterized protein YceK